MCDASKNCITYFIYHTPMLTGLGIKLYSVQRQGRIQSIIIIYA